MKAKPCARLPNPGRVFRPESAEAEAPVSEPAVAGIR